MSVTGSGPEFNIDPLLGRPVSSDSGASVIKKFHEMKEEAYNDLDKKKDDPSWLYAGHPLGNQVNGTELAQYGIKGLLRFGGAGMFGGALDLRGDRDLHPGNKDPLEFMSEFLKNLTDDEHENVRTQFGLDKAELKRFADGMNEALKLAQKVQNIRGDASTMSAEISAFAEELVKKLQDDGVVYFPLADQNGKYHQIVRVDKEHGFSIIEVDANISPYVSKLEDIKDPTVRQDVVKHTRIDPLTGEKVEEYKTQQFVSFEAKNIDRLGDKGFFEALLKHSVLAGANDSQTVTDFIYESLPKYVDGKRLQASESNCELFRKVYRYFDDEDKDSSFQSITSMLYYMGLDPFFSVSKDNTEAVNRFKKIKFLLQTQLFMANVQDLEGKGEWNKLTSNEKIFYQDVKANLMRSAEKLLKKEVLTAEQVQPFFRACMQIDRILARPIIHEIAEGNEEKSEKMNRALLNKAIEGYEPRDSVSSIRVPARVNPAFYGMGGAHRSDDTVEAKPAETMIREICEHDYTLDFAAEADVDKEIKDLGESIDHLSGIYRNLRNNPTLTSRGSGGYPTSASTLERRAVFDMYSKTLGDLISQLPAPKRGADSYWSGLTSDQQQQYFDQFERLTILVQAFATLERDHSPRLEDEDVIRGHSPETSIMMFALQTLHLKLASHMPEYHLEEQTFNFLEYLLEMRSRRFVVEHSGLRKMIHSYMRYYNPDWNIEETTRRLTEGDYKEGDTKLFGFAKKEGDTWSTWGTSLQVKSKEKSLEQQYFEKMLEQPGVRDGVKEIIRKKNEEADERDRQAWDQYRRDVEEFNRKKRELEQQISTKRDEITAAKEQNDLDWSRACGDLSAGQLTDLKRLVEIEKQLSGWWKPEHLESEKILLQKKLASVADLPKRILTCERVAEQCSSRLDPLKSELAGLRLIGRLGNQHKPVEPVYEGHYPEDSVVDQLACLLFDDEGRQLIPEKMNAIIQSVLRGKYLLSKQTVDFDLDRQGLHFTFTGRWRPLPLDAQTKRNKIDVEIVVAEDGQRAFAVQGDYRNQFDLDQYSHSRLMSRPGSNYPTWSDRVGYDLLISDLDLGYRNQNRTQNEVMHSTMTLFDLDVRTTRELRMIGLDPYDSVSRAIGFLSRNMNLMKNPAVRDYLHELLFMPDRIHTQLRDNPHLCKKIDDFIGKAVGHYTQMSDIDSCLSLVRLGEELKQAAIKVLGEDASFSNYRDLVLQTVIPRFKDDPSAQLKAYRTLVMLHANEDTATDDLIDESKKSEIVQDLLALRVNRQLQTTASRVSQADDALTNKAILRFQHLMQGEIPHIDLTYALKVTGKADDLDEESVWNSIDNVTFTSGHYELNINTGQVFINGVALVETPDWITDNETLRRVYPYSFDSKTCTKVNNAYYILNAGDPEKEVHVTSLDYGQTIQIERQIHGDSYRYLETPDELSRHYPTLFDNKVVCWVSRTGSMRVFSDGVEKYAVKLDNSDGQCGIESITRVHDGSTVIPFNFDLGIVNPQDISQRSSLADLFSPIAAFEKDQRQIECWMSKNNQKIFVDFKRLGLSFEVRNDEIRGFMGQVNVQEKIREMLRLNQVISSSGEKSEIKLAQIELMIQIQLNELRDLFPVHCQNYPGFSLANPVLMQSLESGKVPYITLQSESGEKKVLVPNMSEGRIDPGAEDFKWFEYDVVKVKTDGITSYDLASHNVEQQLLQMIMYADQRNFAKVQKILNKINPLEALTVEETGLLERLAFLLNRYQHPEANALVVKLLLLKEVNALKFPQAKMKGEQQAEEGPNDLMEVIQTIGAKLVAYENYRKTCSKAASFRLTREEERQFVEILYHEFKEKQEAVAKTMQNDDPAYSIGDRLMKSIKNKLVKLAPTVLMGVVEQRLGQRYHDLSTQEGKLGAKKVTLIGMPDPEEIMSGKDQKMLISNETLEKLFLDRLGVEGTELPIPKDLEIDAALNEFDKNAQYWEDNFYTLYHVARSGTLEQKDKLQRELDLATHINAGGHRLLRWVMQKPSRYPTLEKINQKVKKWKVEAPKKIEEASDVKAAKEEKLREAKELNDQAYRKVRDHEDLESDAIGVYSSIKSLKSALKRAQDDLARPDRGGWGGINPAQVVEDLERRVRQYEQILPGLKAARADYEKAQKALDKAQSEFDKAEKALEGAQKYLEKMEQEVKKSCTSMLPSKLWTIIQKYVRPIFELIPKLWKLFWKGKTLLNKRVYPVRDIFSTNKVGRTREAIEVDRVFLKEIDSSFNSYFEELIGRFFDVRAEDHTGDTDWDARDGGVDLVEGKLQREKDALDEYRSTVRKMREHAELKSGLHDIQDLMNELSQKEQVLSVSLIQQKEALVWQLNRAVNENEKEKMIAELNRGGQKADLTWDDLKSLTLSGDLQQFRDKTGLDDAEASELMRGVADFLVKATRLNQLRFVKSKVAKALGAETTEKKKVYYTNVVEALKQKRHYLNEEGTENTILSRQDMKRLWFEYSNGYLYREQQIKTLDSIGSMRDPEILMEAPTGFGKSKNYIPSRDFEMSEEHLVLNIHPRTIERINAEDIQQQMRDSFGRKADRFHFQRSTQFTVQSLKKMYEEMQVNFEEGRPINFSAETLQALELHFLMTMYDYKEADKAGTMSAEDRVAAKQEIEYFILILRAISVYGWATIDESHVNLNPFTNKLIYTIGDSTTLESYQVDILEEIMDIMVTDEEITDLARIDEYKQAKVTDEQYALISRKLGKHFADKYNIGDENRDEFMSFVLGELDTVPQWIAKHPQAKKLALVKGMLSLILKSCMDGYVDENFGLSKLHFDKGKEYAIAFASANTPKENETNPSQFKNPHETMIKTYLTYLHKGLRESQVVKMLKQMQQQQLQEFETTGDLESTESNRAFVEIAGQGHSLHELTEDQMRGLYDDFHNNKKAIFYYVKTIIVPQLKLYDKTLVNTPQNLRSRFQTSESLSATPQHEATHGPDTVMVPMAGTQGQVSHLFLKKVDSESKIHTSEGSSPQEVLESAIDTVLKNDHLKCIIDAGALMRGLSNEHIAGTLRQEILKRGADHIEAIQYFDVERENFVVMEVSTGTLSDPSVVKIHPSKIITIFDQPRCFGSDTVQDEVASALLLVDSRTDKAKAGQGAGRMRQWHLDQGMEVLMTKEEHTALFGDREANIGDLLTLWVKNLAHQEAKENYQGLLQQMDNELRAPAMHCMLGIRTGNRHKGEKDAIRDEKPDVEKALRLFSKFESILVTDDSSDPWRLYAEIPQDQKPEESLDAHLKRTQTKARKMGGFSSSQRKILKSRLGRYSKKWNAPTKPDQKDERVSLPERVKSSKVDTGTQVEVQVQAEQEVEEQVEEQRWDDFVQRTPSKWSDKINLFKSGWEKPRRQFVFLNRCARAIGKLEPENPVLKAVVRAGLVVAGTALAATAAAVAGVAWPIVVAIGSVLAVAGLAYVAYSAFAGRNVKYVQNSTYKVRDIMGTHLPARAKRGARFFSPNLTVSNNYYAQHTPTWREKEQKPFSQEQKPAFNVLVIEDTDKKGKTRLQMMMIDQNDSVYFRRRLQADYEKVSAEDADNRSRKIAVYDVANGTIAVQGKNGFAEGELEAKKEFVELLTQAKVVNGDIHFTEEERTAITVRAQNVGADFMEAFAQDEILSEHPIRKALFQHSDFKKALEAVN